MVSAPNQSGSTPTTIKDVARKAGVSTATVSRVLSGKGKVSQGLTDQVHQAIHELNYRPSRVARNLRVRKASTIGLLVSDLQNPFFTSILRGVQDVLQARGFVLLVANSDEDRSQEKLHLETLLAEEVTGIILAPATDQAEDYQNILREGVGLVVIDRIPKDLKVDSVLVDNVTGARAAVAHLISLGHEHIGILSGPKHISTAALRLEGYQNALVEAGLPFDEQYVYMGNFRQESGSQGMQALLALHKPPTAVFSCNNVMTLGALQAIHENCLHIPRDIALVGFDDMPWSASLQPPLTAVAQPTYEIGTTAANLLMDRVQAPDRPVRQVILGTELIIRASTAHAGCA